MKFILILAMMITGSAFANIERTCVEFEFEANETNQLISFAQAKELLKIEEEATRVNFRALDDKKFLGCEQLVEELIMEGEEAIDEEGEMMALIPEKSMHYCVYKQAEKEAKQGYGWVCKK